MISCLHWLALSTLTDLTTDSESLDLSIWRASLVSLSGLGLLFFYLSLYFLTFLIVFSWTCRLEISSSLWTRRSFRIPILLSIVLGCLHIIPGKVENFLTEEIVLSRITKIFWIWISQLSKDNDLLYSTVVWSILISSLLKIQESQVWHIYVLLVILFSRL